MIDRFKDNGADSLQSPDVARFMGAWTEAEETLRQNWPVASQVVANAAIRHFTERDVNFQIEAEAALNAAVPELVTALDGLKRSLDKLNGWKIDWNHFDSGRFEPMSGWIVGSYVGPTPVTLSLGAWVEVALVEGQTQGINMSLAEMFEVQLTPPNDTALTD